MLPAGGAWCPSIDHRASTASWLLRPGVRYRPTASPGPRPNQPGLRRSADRSPPRSPTRKEGLGRGDRRGTFPRDELRCVEGFGSRRLGPPAADSNRRGRRVALAGPEYRPGPPAGQAPPRDKPGMGRFDVGSGTIASGIRPLHFQREHRPFGRPRIASASGPAVSASVTDKSCSWRPLTSVRSTPPVQKRWTNSSGGAGNGSCAAVCRPVRLGVGCRDGQQTGPARRKPSQPPNVNVPAATATTLPTFPAARRCVKKP